MPDSSIPDLTRVENSRKSTVNFSRPRIFKDYVSNERKDSVVPSPPVTAPVKSIRAIYEPPPRHPDEEPLPDEPRFSIDTLCGAEAPGNGYRQQSVFSEIQRQTSRDLGTLRSGPQLRHQDQRHPGPKASLDQLRKTSSQSVNGDRNGNATPRPPTQDSNSTATSRPATGDSLKPPAMPLKSILKKTEVEQYSEPASSEAGEDRRSHHTVSESGSGSFDSTGKWHASDFDTSTLSEKDMKKLVKKGINPSLYLEMKAARSGKSFVGALTGNTYA